MNRRSKLLVLLLFVCLPTFAQIQVTFPISRIVLQRDNQNKATVSIAGNYYQTLEKIEAKFVPVVAGQGTETPWTLIQNSPSNGIFRGTMSVQGGWYILQVRGLLYGNVVATSQVDRVGIGEVFIVAGQSNAQGDNAYPGSTIGAQDDRVSTIDYQDDFLDENKLPFEFSQFGDNKKMAPYHYVPWFWARLGDQMARRLNVPILFYGAGTGGIGSDRWKRSAAGEDLRAIENIFVRVAGMPYRALKAALQQYTTRTGVRAVLWQQGESDDVSSTSTYFNNMKFVIDKSRQDSKKSDLPWVVARCSRNPSYHQNVIDGQNQLIQQVSSVFAGPNTDDINDPLDRYDGIHFMLDGLNKTANSWNFFLNDSFLANSNPLLPAPILPISLNCAGGNNSFSLTAGAGYNSYSWSSGQNVSSVNVGLGTYSVKASDEVGNTYFSQPITIINQAIKPAIFSDQSNLCQGSSLTLSTNLSNGIVWSTGESSSSIVVKNAGNYSVTYYNVYGCTYTSDIFTVNAVSIPTTSVNINGPTTICPTDSVTLTAASANVSYSWNNGSTARQITVNQAGIYSLRVRDQNGCQSLPVSVNVIIRTPPSTSIVTSNNLTAFCAGTSLNLSSATDNVSYQWNTGAQSKQITVKDAGTYSLKVKDVFGCISALASINLSILPLPQTNILASGPTSFCIGDSIKLNASIDKVSYLWSTGAQSKQITVSKAGNYSLKVKDSNGCESIPVSINITNYALPVNNITTNGLTTICTGSNLQLTATFNAVSYAWSTGETTKQITVKDAGTYSLKIKDSNGCQSLQTSVLIVVKPLPAIPQISQKSIYFLQETSSGTTVGDSFEWKKEDTALPAKTSEIKASNSGSYTVRAAIHYALTNNDSLVCYSAFSTPFSFIVSPDDQGFTVYPNPSRDGIVFLETRQDLASTILSLYTLQGQLVFTDNINNLKLTETLDLRGIGKGYYILQIKSESFSKRSRILLDY